MIPVSVATRQDLVAPSRKRAICIALTRQYGSALAVKGTSWDGNLAIADGSPTDNYYSTSGGAISDIDSSAALSVDNGEIKANFDAITAADLQSGLWRDADFSAFEVNPDNLTLDPRPMLGGRVGQITIERLNFVAELRGPTQVLQQSFGDIVGPCPYNFGDANTCKRSLIDRTVTGTAESVSDDGLTWQDSARTEAGPVVGANIVSITSSGNKAVVTMDAALLDLREGDTVTLSVVGPLLLNGPHTIHNPDGAHFDIFVDISDTGLYPAFVSGTVTPEGSESGYFGYGLMTITSGANAGIVREVKTSQPGQWTLQDAFPFTVTGTEDYSMVAGCDKKFETCRDKHGNQLNYGGEPNVRGSDWQAQVGRNE